MKPMVNEMKVSFSALSVNEGFARTVAAAFIVGLNPTISELTEVKTAVSEAVTNAIIHGYENKGADKLVHMRCVIDGGKLYIEVADEGIGIQDVEKAREPMYTSKPEQERSGMGFAVMESFMDDVSVTTEPGKGTTISMVKNLHE
jgi:stage II sporulation protein AB (anti-sigma F factor)